MTKEEASTSRQLVRGERSSPSETPASLETAPICAEVGCGKTFSTKSNLTRHRRDQHPSKTFPPSRQLIRGQLGPLPETPPLPETANVCDEEG
ncbi:hypothetical protein BGX27_001896, partial [Mortierella sp. AM989]